MKQLIKLTTESLLNNSSDWIFTEYTADNTKIGVSIWIANGILTYGFYKPFPLSISLIDKFRLYTAIQKCKQNILINKFNERIQE